MHLCVLRIESDLLKIDNFDVWWMRYLSISEKFNRINELCKFQIDATSL